MGKLDGKTAIVTGASRGIGKEISMVLASEGANVVCAARTLDEGAHFLEGSLRTTVAEIEKEGGTALAVQADVTDEESCANLVKATKEAFGPVDVLVNNAALAYYIPIEDFVVRRWVTAFAVNVHGPFMMIKQVMPGMIERRKGAIVNISSGAAIGPGRGPYKDAGHGGTMYGATKAALERFTQGLAEELYQYGISVSAVSPSNIVPTPGTVHHRLVTGMDDPRGEPPNMMARAVLLLATESVDKVSGRVTYSQQILKEFGWIEEAKGRGIDSRGSGYSEI